MRNRKRLAFLHIDLAVLITALSTGSVLAQQTPLPTPQRCEASAQVGWLGISGLECSNCTMSSERMSFSTEPRITAVATGSPAANVLRPGDVILSVNGSLITTTEG